MIPAERYGFGDVTVDIRRMEVRRAGAVVPLEPKSFDVLRLLVENRDRLVTKEELLDVVWKGTFVTPNVLTRAVAQLRKGLGDDAREARYIETVAKRGYRFIAPVTSGEPHTAGDGPLEPILVLPARPSLAARRWLPFATTGLAVAALVWAAGSWADRGSPASETARPTPRPFTGDARYPYLSPAVSPDGGTVAYSHPRTGPMEIYVKGLAEGSREIAITSDGGGNVDSAFSPDGKSIAFYSRRRKGIWIVPSTGGTARQVATFGSSPAWSPDSRRLVFTSWADGALSSQGELWTVAVDGTAPVRLTQPGTPAGGHVTPAWSRDGRLIAFRVGRDETHEIWNVPAAGGTPRHVARGSRPAFSPDDRALYWTSATPEGTACLMRVRIDRDGAPDGDPEVIVPFPGFAPLSYSIGSDLTAVMSLTRVSVNLFAIDFDANGDAGPPKQLTFDDAINTFPDYGPNGRLAFQQVGPDRRSAAWLMDDDGRNPEVLSTGSAASVSVPQWEAQGARVFVFGDQGTRQPYFAWIDLATRRLTRIPGASSDVHNQPSLSPDGQRVAFNVVGADGIVNVWVQRLDTGERRQVTFDREAMSYPRWSPDGRWLAVNVRSGNDANVGVVPAEGGPVEHLTSGAAMRWPYSFSPDGDRIAFSESFRGLSNIYSVSRRTREVKQLTRFTSGLARYAAWSPNGNRIVFEFGEQSTSLWTVKLPK